MTGSARTTTSGGRLEMLSPGSKNRTQRAVGTPAAPAHRSPSPQLTKSSACAERLWRAHTAIVSQQMCQLVRCGNSSRGKCDLLRAPLRIEFLRYHRPQLQVVSETAVVGRLDRSRVSLRQRSGLGEDRWALKHR